MEAYQDISLALLQIRSVPLGTGLPSSATMLFSRPVRGLLPQKNRGPINVDNNDTHNEALEVHQKYKGNDTIKTILFLHERYSRCTTGRWGLWIHGVIVEGNSSDHRGHSYNIWITKTGRLITCKTKCINITISSKKYLYEQIKKVAGWLEGMFIQTVPVNAVGLPTLHASDNRMEAIQYKGTVYQEMDSISPIGQDCKNSGRHESDSTSPTGQIVRLVAGIMDVMSSQSTLL